MHENEKKALTGVAIVLGYFVWFMGVVASSGVRTSKRSHT
jgi:hypothetical protein